MGKCSNHPDRETSFLCLKHNIYMCEECIKCREPEMFCKFRLSCPIWFMDKRQKDWDREARAQEEVKTFKVIFKPEDREISVSEGSTLLDAAVAADIHINASCNGKGSCGKCKLILESGNIKSEPTSLLSDQEKEKSYILACQTKVLGDVTVKIPEETIERKLKVAGMGQQATDRFKGLVKDIRPMLIEIPLELEPPTLDDSASDLDRLNRGLKKTGCCDVEKFNVGIKVMRELATAMREENWNVTASVIRKKCANEILNVRPGNGQEKSLGLAIDVGTTSIVVYLVDMTDGSIIAATSGHNRQSACGDDVINRIVCAEKDGVAKLSRMALSTINNLINEALASVNGNFKDIKNVVIAGNTTMTHLLLKIEPRYIRREPYIPSVSEFPILKAGEIGIKANPIAAVFIIPGPASYVGGDIVAGVLACGMADRPETRALIDVGTNGEIALGNSEWMVCCSASAGPAFEGGGIKNGMRATRGAIERVEIEDGEVRYTTIGKARPRGICGSGLIDLIYGLVKNGIINHDGRFDLSLKNERVVEGEGNPGFVVARAGETESGKDLIVTETDIENIIRSKGAVFAAIKSLVDYVGLGFEDIETFFVAGGFGTYLNIPRAIGIGLLPDIDPERIRFIGNSSLMGARMALLSSHAFERTLKIAKGMTNIELSTYQPFMDEYVAAMFLPHTDSRLFPSVHY